MAREKREKADARAAALAQAAKGAKDNYQTASKIKEYEKQTHFGPASRQQYPPTTL